MTLGAERNLRVAFAAFCMRATLMQASTPLLQSYVMELLPPERRARSTSFNNLVWNSGWAASATLSGWIIERFGYAMPFYITAALYGSAAVYFYLMFRSRTSLEASLPMRLTEEAKGNRGEGPFTE